MKFKKAVKLIAACTTIAAGIGAAVYLVKDKMDRKSLSEDFDDDFEDDFDDFEDDAQPESREYVNLNCQTNTSKGSENETESPSAEEDAAPSDEAQDAIDDETSAATSEA